MSLPYQSLKRRQDFLRLTKSGYKIPMSSFVLQALSRPSPNEEALSLLPRIGFTASKKIGNAVIRNKARRRLKAAIAIYLKENPISAPLPLDFVLVARSTTPTIVFTKILEDFKKAFSKLYDSYIPTLQPPSS